MLNRMCNHLSVFAAVPFEGERTLKDLTKFIKETATVPYELKKKASDEEEEAVEEEAAEEEEEDEDRDEL